MMLRMAEAQQLMDALSDPLIQPALEAFFLTQHSQQVECLLQAVQQHIRDTMKESRLAGKAEAYRECLPELRRFAEEQLRSAVQ